MVTSERLTRLKLALEFDDDEILGEHKKKLISSIDKASKMYKKWEAENSLRRLHELVKAFLVPELKEQLKDEACDILVDLIDKDCQKENIPTERLRDINKNYLLYVVRNSHTSSHNKKICEVALGISKYVPGMFNYKRKNNYDLTEDEEDEENDQ